MSYIQDAIDLTDDPVLVTMAGILENDSIEEFDKIDKLAAILDDIKVHGICRTDAMAINTLSMEALDDGYPIATYTERRTDMNLTLSMEGIGRAIMKGIMFVLELLGKILARIFAIIAFPFTFLFKRAGGGSGGGGLTTPEKVLETVEKEELKPEHIPIVNRKAIEALTHSTLPNHSVGSISAIAKHIDLIQKRYTKGVAYAIRTEIDPDIEWMHKTVPPDRILTVNGMIAKMASGIGETDLGAITWCVPLLREIPRLVDRDKILTLLGDSIVNVKDAYSKPSAVEAAYFALRNDEFYGEYIQAAESMNRSRTKQRSTDDVIDIRKMAIDAIYTNIETAFKLATKPDAYLGKLKHVSKIINQPVDEHLDGQGVAKVLGIYDNGRDVYFDIMKDLFARADEVDAADHVKKKTVNYGRLVDHARKLKEDRSILVSRMYLDLVKEVDPNVYKDVMNNDGEELVGEHGKRFDAYTDSFNKAEKFISRRKDLGDKDQLTRFLVLLKAPIEIEQTYMKIIASMSRLLMHEVHALKSYDNSLTANLFDFSIETEFLATSIYRYNQHVREVVELYGNAINAAGMDFTPELANLLIEEVSKSSKHSLHIPYALVSLIGSNPRLKEELIKNADAQIKSHRAISTIAITAVKGYERKEKRGFSVPISEIERFFTSWETST